jgi:hypothetical protein
MNTQEAIRQLQKLKQDKEQKKFDDTSNAFANSLNTFKNIIVGVMADLTGLTLKNRYDVSVKNFPKTTTLDNKLLKVEVTNHPKKEEIEKVEVVNQPEIVFSTTKIEEELSKLILQGNKVPPQLETSRISVKQLGTNLIDSLETLLKAVKAIKLNPEIKVTSPKIEIPAPIVNIPKVEFPKPQKSIEVSNLNLNELENKMEELITEIKYQSDKPVKVSNPGDFPVTFSIPAYRDVDGNVAQAKLDANGFVIMSNSGLGSYELQDKVSDGTTVYLGNIDVEGNWYIAKVETGSTTSFRYATVKNNPTKTLYSVAWTAKLTLDYDYYSIVF